MKNDNSNLFGLLFAAGIVVVLLLFVMVNAHNKNAIPSSNSSSNGISTSTNSSNNTGSSTSTPVASTTTVSKPSAPTCYTAAQAWNEEGQTGCVTMTVGYTYAASSGNDYLDQYQDYSSGVGVWIPSGYSFGSSLLNKYSGQTINVSGTITQYDGAPEIEVTSPSQITLAQ